MARRRPPVGVSWGDFALAVGLTVGFLAWARARDAARAQASTQGGSSFKPTTLGAAVR